MTALRNYEKDFQTINVIQGDYAVTADPNTALVTILGSCVATCLYDPVARIGGLNHFLLPGFCDSSSGTMSCGLNMMELLINALLKGGAQRDRLQAKIFGGANMNKGLTDIGSQNVDFTRTFMAHEGIVCVGASVGGMVGRRIQFWPESGKARQKLLSTAETTAIERKVVKEPAPVPDSASDVELF
ncbi:MAG: chemotaxis protein CheD [Robiginitomaculum sp.]|nr:MAG: chemotaxis protein CheD [Robiginitomaculum sp.]